MVEQSQLRTNRPWESGMVTAELATTMPAVAMMLLVVMALVAVSGVQMRASDAARVGARIVATGVPADQVKSQLVSYARVRPEDISISAPDLGWVTVTVQQTVRLGPVWLGPLTATGKAIAWLEPCVTTAFCPFD